MNPENPDRLILSPSDDLPIHQIAEPIRYVATTDRNFYDRYYFNAHRRDTSTFLVAGMGQYPNLGVADAFLAVRRGDVQRVARASRLLGTDRMDTTVGPFRIEVLEGLKRLRFVCDSHEDLDLGADLTWNGVVPAIAEPRHYYRAGTRVVSDTMRLAQTGAWSGTLSVAGEVIEVNPKEWGGGRDRSWGVRPVGEAEPRGAREAAGSPGFFWIYATPQFDSFSLVVIVHEDRYGRRILEEAVRIWPDGDGRPPQSLGQPDHEVTFRSRPGSEVERLVLSFAATDERMVVEPLTAVHLALGTGYGIEPDWRHGMYQGAEVVQARQYDLDDPETRRRSRGLVDHLARFEFEGQVGYGLFEFAVLGPNDKYGRS